MSRRLVVCALLGCAGLLAAPRSARAEGPETAYCKKVRARAASDAAILVAPSAVAQAIKFPRDGALDSGTTVGTSYQVRAGLSWSPLDAYKSIGIRAVADADCAQHEAETSAAEMLSSGDDIGRRDALAKELEFLAQNEQAWTALVTLGEERLAAGAGTLAELREIRTRATALERKRAQVEGDIARLASRVPASVRSVAALRTELEATSARYEEASSHVRGLAAWQLSVTGGVVPQDKPFDWFGVVQLSYSFGGPLQIARENEAREARAEEVSHARYALVGQLAALHDRVHASLVQARKELVVLEGESRSVAEASAKLASSTGPDAVQSRAIAQLDAIAIESERIYTATLVSELAVAEEATK